MYCLGEDFQYERQAKISVNLEEQISLANLNVPIRKKDVVAVSLDGKNVQIGEVSTFTNTSATILLYKKTTAKDQSIIWKLTKKDVLKKVDRKKILHSGLKFTKKMKLKKNSMKYLNSYKLI
jgi:hypothetical protein